VYGMPGWVLLDVVCGDELPGVCCGQLHGHNEYGSVDMHTMCRRVLLDKLGGGELLGVCGG
jgi:hypothetical protein